MNFYGMPGMASMPSGDTAGPPSVAMDQQTSLFRYGEQSIWSTYFWPANAAVAQSVNRTFQTQIGGTGQGFTRGLTIGETNIKQGGRVPNGIAYDVFGISAHIMAASAATDVAGTDWDATINTDALIQNATNLMYNGVLTWDFTQTRIDVAPLSLCGSGGGVFGSIGIVSNNEQRAGHLGNGPGSIWLYRKHPVSLPGETTFAMLIQFGNRAAAIATAGMGVKISLFGFYKNVIEIG